jgi:hypothetical protein
MLSRHTAYAIATRTDILISHSGPKEGKFRGWITLGEADRYRALVSTDLVFNSAAEAEQAMHDLVRDTKVLVEIELKGRDPVTALMEDACTTSSSSAATTGEPTTKS